VGDYLYVMTSDGQLACLSRIDGGTIWIRKLPQYENEERRRGRIAWAGPVLAGGQLLLISSEGEMLTLSPFTGETIDELRLGDDVFIPPVVADGTVLVLTDKASLIAFR
jgi:outer membrane protein assembly factor BamB